MQQAGSHIISRFRWNTSFDRKEKAAELQDRLSSWSRLSMQQEILDIFDRICPPGQTWRIEHLELNLGSVDFNDLEFELALKLRQVLTELLTDLVLHSGSKGRSTIEILNEDASHISVLRSFLLSGVMPWNHRPEDGSLNQLVAGQLQHNRPELIAMLREIGAGSELVRKRIAWQINDAGITRIIEGLEPNNHTQVIDFSTEMVKIQMKETVVQASTADFRKNLWLWILNYLLTERGTIFNKVAFMRSSIRQMAAYYNIAYLELLELIERAVAIVSRMSGIKSDFIKTLQQLSGESRDKNRDAADAEEHDPAVLRAQFTRLFRQRSLRNSGEAKTDFNELVIGLYRQDVQAFRSLLLSLGSNATLWTQAINDLNDAALEVIVAALNAAQADMVVESVYFLHRAGHTINRPWKRKSLWKLAIRFLVSQKNASFDRSAFIEHCIMKLSEKNKLLRFQLLQQVIAAQLPVASRTLHTLELYNALGNAFIAAAEAQDDAFIHENITSLLHAMAQEIHSASTDKTLFTALKKMLVKNMLLQPKRTLGALVAYADKAQLAELLSYLLDAPTAQVLLKQAPQELVRSVSTVKQAAAELKALEKTAVLVIVLDALLPLSAIETLVLHTAFSAERFTETLLDALADHTVVGTSQLQLFAELLLREERRAELGISNAFAIALLKRYTDDRRISLSGKVQLLRAATADKQSAMVQLLRMKFSAASLAQVGALKAEEQNVLLETLVTGGGRFMQAVIKEYGAFLQKELEHLPPTAILQQLTGLYWKVILNYPQHKGSKNAVLRAFREAVAYTYFPASAGLSAMQADVKKSNVSGITGNGIHEGAGIRFSNGMQLPAAALAQLIREAISSGETEIKYKGAVLSLQEILAVAAGQGAAGKELGVWIKEAERSLSVNGTILSSAVLYELVEQAFLEEKQEIIYKGNTFRLDQLLGMALQRPMLSRSERRIAENATVYRLRNGKTLPAALLRLLLKESFVTGANLMERQGIKVRRKELILLALQDAPVLLREALRDKRISVAKKLRVLETAVSFHSFSSHIFADRAGTEKEVMEALRLLYNLFTHLAPAAIVAQLLKDSWQLSLKLLTASVSDPAARLRELTEATFRRLEEEGNIGSAQIITAIKTKQLQLNPLLTGILEVLFPSISASGLQEWSTTPAVALQRAEAEGLLEELCLQLVAGKPLPAWYEAAAAEKEEELLNAVILHYPVVFVTVLRKSLITETQFSWLHASVDLPQLLRTIGGLHKEKQALLSVTAELYRAAGKLSIKGISAAAVQYLLFRKVLKAWSSGNWRILAAEQIWNELIWDAQARYGVSKNDFLQGVKAAKLYLPLSVQVALEQLQNSSRRALPAITEKKQLPKAMPMQIHKPVHKAKGGIIVKNAGMVLINSYIQVLFDRLGVTAGKKFTSEQARLDAPHYLQYVATGMAETEESLLPLNKVLCGIPLEEPLREGITITDEHKQLINGLLKAMIGYWPAIGDCSINGFRGNWLVREGLLTEQEERWELTVEKRAYDVLIHQSPFSFSIIKLPWMEKPLHVTWPY